MTFDPRASFLEAEKVLQEFFFEEENMRAIADAVALITETLKSGGKVLSCGNGGSMCDSMHFAEELTGRFIKDRPALGAIALGDIAHTTCTANDYGYNDIFSRMVDAIGRSEDLLLGISTSGNSENVIKAVHAAKSKGMKVVALLGKDGGKLRSMVDLPLVVKSKTTARVQEVHIKIIHTMIEGVERSLFPELY